MTAVKRRAATQQWERVLEVGDRMERGEQVLAVDLLFTGDEAPSEPSHLITEMLAAVGERPLGMEAAQLAALAHWAQNRWSPPESVWRRRASARQVVALVAAALEPGLFAEAAIHDGMHSLSYLLAEAGYV